MLDVWTALLLVIWNGLGQADRHAIVTAALDSEARSRSTAIGCVKSS